MASPNEPAPSRRRLGRRRLPPLEPGPALQFVIANHPDQFRAGKTMRNVRSHVMYKHRIERKSTANERTNTNLQRSTSAYASSAPSPASSSLETLIHDVDHLTPPQSRPRSSTWTADSPEDISYYPSPSTLRTLICRILSSSQGPYARSAPPMFEDATAFPFPGFYSPYSDSLNTLKQHYIESHSLLGKDREWMRTICADQTSFLSHVSVSSVYQDLSEGFWQDSGTTVQVKTHVLRAIAGQLESNDATILSILHLLLSEVGGDESAFKVHYQGLQGLINRRGGMSQLPDQLVTYMALILTALATLKPLTDSAAWHTFNPTPSHTLEPYLYVSPLYAPQSSFAPLHTSCSTHTLEIITTMYSLTQTFLHTKETHRPFTPSRTHHQFHEHLLRAPKAREAAPTDWIHESIRLAALIQTRALLHRTTLATAASTLHHSATPSTLHSATPSTLHSTASTTNNTTLLAALLNAVKHTDASSCWGALRGVFAWVCITGAASSWGRRKSHASGGTDASHSSPGEAWTRKYFSLWAIKAAVEVEPMHTGGTIAMLKTGLRVRNLLDACEE